MQKRRAQRRYCPTCKRRTGTVDEPGICEVHGEAGQQRYWSLRIAPTVPRVNYDRYINSPKWRRIRAIIIARDSGLCMGCGSAGNHVHHIHYRTLGDETGAELVLLCKPCHDGEHESYRLKAREAYWTEIINRTELVTAALDREYRAIVT